MYPFESIEFYITATRMEWENYIIQPRIGSVIAGYGEIYI